MKAKPTNNYPASDDLQVNPATESQWLMQPLPRRKMVQKADAVQALVDHTRKLLFQGDDCC